MKFIYLICPVRGCSEEVRTKLDAYVAKLEEDDCMVHYPHRDVPQDGTEVDIIGKHVAAMLQSDEVHVWWDGNSTGSHFDLGIAWLMKWLCSEHAISPTYIKIVIANPGEMVLADSGMCYGKWLKEIAE